MNADVSAPRKWGAEITTRKPDMSQDSAHQKPESKSALRGAACCSDIFDCNGTPMNAGDSFRYQFGTPYECLVSIAKLDECLWLDFHGKAANILLADFWYAPTDEKISIKHNSPNLPSEKSGAAEIKTIYDHSKSN